MTNQVFIATPYERNGDLSGEPITFGGGEDLDTVMRAADSRLGGHKAVVVSRAEVVPGDLRPPRGFIVAMRVERRDGSLTWRVGGFR